jgi:hypothetical protein
MWKSLKRWPVLLALLMVIGLVSVALHYLVLGSRVTRDNFEKIKQGMSRQEVEAILGKPNWEGPWGASLRLEYWDDRFKKQARDLVRVDFNYRSKRVEETAAEILAGRFQEWSAHRLTSTRSEWSSNQWPEAVRRELDSFARLLQAHSAELPVVHFVEWVDMGPWATCSIVG